MSIFIGPISPTILILCTYPIYKNHFSEELVEDDQFPDHKLVEILLAKLYFYLNDYD